MTLTPIDFTVIVGFCFIIELVEFSSELVTDKDSVKVLLGLSPLLEKYRGV